MEWVAIRHPCPVETPVGVADPKALQSAAVQLEGRGHLRRGGLGPCLSSSRGVDGRSLSAPGSTLTQVLRLLLSERELTW